MRTKLAILVLASAAASGCSYTPHDLPDRGLAAVNVPVVTSADYVFDASAPGGALAPGEGERLNGWFQGLGLGYGDIVYVDGAYADRAQVQVAQVAGRYGMVVTPGAPVTAEVVPAIRSGWWSAAAAPRFRDARTGAFPRNPITTTGRCPTSAAG